MVASCLQAPAATDDLLLQRVLLSSRHSRERCQPTSDPRPKKTKKATWIAPVPDLADELTARGLAIRTSEVARGCRGLSQDTSERPLSKREGQARSEAVSITHMHGTRSGLRSAALLQSLRDLPPSRPQPEGKSGDAQQLDLREVQGRLRERQERVEDLKRDMDAFDAERMGHLAIGTALLQQDDGQPWLPIPPQDPAPRSVRPGRLRVLRHMVPVLAEEVKRPGEDQKPSSGSREPRSMNFDEGQRRFPNCPSKQAVWERLAVESLLAEEDDEVARRIYEVPPRPVSVDEELVAKLTPAAAREGLVCKREKARHEQVALLCLTTAELIQQAERMEKQADGSVEQWLRLGQRVQATAYELTSPEALSLVSTLSRVAVHFGGERTRSGSELFHIVDHVLSALSWRLRSAEMSTLAMVLEVMAETQVGSQDFLDMVIAQILRCQRQASQVVVPVALALRVASVLGRISFSSVLRPEGTTQVSRRTSSDVMTRLNGVIKDGAGQLLKDSFIQLNDYYLSRVCDEDTRIALVCRMAELEMGLGPSSPIVERAAVLKLQESLEFRCGNSFRWCVPPSVRRYLDSLRELRLQEQE